MSQRKKDQKGQPHYPVEVKELAVARLQAGESVATIASEVGCGVGRLYYWRDRWEKNGRQWPELAPEIEVAGRRRRSAARSGKRPWSVWWVSSRRSWIFFAKPCGL